MGGTASPLTAFALGLMYLRKNDEAKACEQLFPVMDFIRAKVQSCSKLLVLQVAADPLLAPVSEDGASATEIKLSPLATFLRKKAPHVLKAGSPSAIAHPHFTPSLTASFLHTFSLPLAQEFFEGAAASTSVATACLSLQPAKRDEDTQRNLAEQALVHLLLVSQFWRAPELWAVVADCMHPIFPTHAGAGGAEQGIAARHEDGACAGCMAAAALGRLGAEPTAGRGQHQRQGVAL